MLDKIFKDIEIECNNAMNQYPNFASTHEGYAVIKEEVDELWDLVKSNKGVKGNIKFRKECIQIAAMAVRFIKDLC
jgi:hypothetical protein